MIIAIISKQTVNRYFIETVSDFFFLCVEHEIVSLHFDVSSLLPHLKAVSFALASTLELLDYLIGK